MRNATNPTRYTVSAVISTRNDERRIHLGTAPSRRKARRIAYRKGIDYQTPRYSSALFSLEILDTVTGEQVSAKGAEFECYCRYEALPTVGDVGYW